MRKLVLSALLAGSLILPEAASAWNRPGHRTIAAIAYLRLAADTRGQVDALLRQHPDFARLSEGVPRNDPDFGLNVFLRAAEWPDVIREDDPRFYDDARADATPTPPLPGFPDMKTHRNWHFTNQGFSTDGTPVRTEAGPNVLTQLLALQKTLGDPAVPGGTRAYNLSWLLHLVGDIHQPLHCTTRYSARHTSGDRGGNSFKLRKRDGNLHSLWDNALTRRQESAELVRLARELMGEIRPDSAEVAVAADPEVSVRHWFGESVALSQYVVYTIGEEKDGPIRVPRWYRRLAQTIARHRAAMAGYRLAELLARRLG